MKEKLEILIRFKQRQTSPQRLRLLLIITFGLNNNKDSITLYYITFNLNKEGLYYIPFKQTKTSLC